MLNYKTLIKERRFVRFGLAFLIAALVGVAVWLSEITRGALNSKTDSRVGQVAQGLNSDASRENNQPALPISLTQDRIAELATIADPSARFQKFLAIRNEVKEDVGNLKILWECAPKLFKGEHLRNARIASAAFIARLETSAAIDLISALPPGTDKTKVISESFRGANVLKLANAYKEVESKFAFPEEKEAYHEAFLGALLGASSEDCVELLKNGGIPWATGSRTIESAVSNRLKSKIYDSASYSGAVASLKGLSKESDIRIRGQILGSIASYKPDLALELFASDKVFREAEGQAVSAKTDIVSGLVENFHKQSPEDAGARVQELPAELRQDAVRSLTSKWLISDSRAASEWISSGIKDPVLAKIAISEMIAILKRGGEIESATAWEEKLKSMQ